MASLLDRLLVQSLQAQIQVSRLHLPKIAEQMKAASGKAESSRLAALYEETRMQLQSMEQELALLGRPREESAAAEVPEFDESLKSLGNKATLPSSGGARAKTN